MVARARESVRLEFRRRAVNESLRLHRAGGSAAAAEIYGVRDGVPDGEQCDGAAGVGAQGSGAAAVFRRNRPAGRTRPPGKLVARTRKAVRRKLPAPAVREKTVLHLAGTAVRSVMHRKHVVRPDGVQRYFRRGSQVADDRAVGELRLHRSFFPPPSGKRISFARVRIAPQRLRLAVCHGQRRHRLAVTAVLLERHRVNVRLPDGVERIRGAVNRRERNHGSLVGENDVAASFTRPAAKSVARAHRTVARQFHSLAETRRLRRRRSRAAVRVIRDNVLVGCPLRRVDGVCSDAGNCFAAALQSAAAVLLPAGEAVALAGECARRKRKRRLVAHEYRIHLADAAVCLERNTVRWRIAGPDSIERHSIAGSLRQIRDLLAVGVERVGVRLRRPAAEGETRTVIGIGFERLGFPVGEILRDVGASPAVLVELDAELVGRPGGGYDGLLAIAGGERSDGAPNLVGGTVRQNPSGESVAGPIEEAFWQRGVRGAAEDDRRHRACAAAGVAAQYVAALVPDGR